MPYDMKTTPLDVAGNIFVDQAMLTLKVLLGKKIKDPVVVQDVVNLKTAPGIEGFTWLANNIDRFKSYAMIYTTNNPRFNAAIKDVSSRIKVFQEILNSLADGVVEEFDPGKKKPFSCDVCGHDHGYDFDSHYRAILASVFPASKNDAKKPKIEPKFTCREFFPLVGTMGSESQAFSNMSKSFVICPRCLLFVYFLPFSSQLIEGSLAIFQVSNDLMQYQLIKIIVDRYKAVINTLKASEEIPNVGKNFKNKNELVFDIFLALFKGVLSASPTKKDMILNQPSSRLSCWLWKYVNSGQKAALSYEIIPSNAVLFIYFASCFDLSAALLDVVHQELKDIKYPPKQIFNAIRRKELYQFERLDQKKIKVDRRLVFLYYFYILDYPREAIRAAVKISAKLLKKDAKGIDITNRSKLPIILNQTCREMLGSKELDLAAYHFLFTFLPRTARAKQGQAIINQIIMLGITVDELTAFDRDISEMMSKDVIDEYIAPLALNPTPVETMVLETAIGLYSYFKAKGMSLDDIQDKIIDKQLKKATMAWFSTVFAQSILAKEASIDIMEFFYVIEKVGSWFLLRMLMRTLFASLVTSDEPPAFLTKEKEKIPVDFRLRHQNLLLERVFSDYLNYRIARQRKGFIYVKTHFIDPIIRGKLNSTTIYNFLHDHAKDNPAVLEADQIQYSLADWDEMTIAPETGTQDMGEFMQYLKIFLACYVVSNKKRLQGLEEGEQAEMEAETEVDVITELVSASDESEALPEAEDVEEPSESLANEEELGEEDQEDDESSNDTDDVE